MRILTSGLRNHASQFGDALLRLARMDDASLDREESRLWRELQRLRDRRIGPPDAILDAALAERARAMVGNGE